MANDQLTTFQIDLETRDKLKILAERYERSMAGQMRWLVNQAWDELMTEKSDVEKRKGDEEKPKHKSQQKEG